MYGRNGVLFQKKKNFQKPKDVLWPRGQTASTCVKPTRCSGRQEHEEESDQTNSRSHRNRGSDQKVLDEQELQSHLLVPSLLYHISYNYILLHIVTFLSLTHYFHAYPPLLFLFVLIILAHPRLCYYVSWYLTTIDLCTHLRDCHPLYNSEVCFCLQCITPILTNPADMINYKKYITH